MANVLKSKEKERERERGRETEERGTDNFYIHYYATVVVAVVSILS